ncbi:MAG TPA: TonB family protein [Paludibacteraceae bacterium]|nr:TonB family protein [Paludibacteraceae bacterium]HQF50889.1 TonB family protein [Paludibacteraceae bacterium]
MSKIDLSSKEWCDLVFDGRNKDYGAYELRQESNKRHIVALVAVILFSIVLFSLPVLISIVTPDKEKIVVMEVTTLSDLQEEETKEENPVEEIDLTPPPPPLKSSIKFTAPIITKAEVKEEEEIKTQEEVTQSKVTISTADIKGTDEENGQIIDELNEIVQEPQKEEKPYIQVEQMPQFPGGNEAMLKYIASNLRYPTIAQENGIQGKVYVRFVIDKNGKISHAEVLRGLDSTCDKEAIRVILSMPQWIPGKQNGKTVPVVFTVPVHFKLL